MELGLALPHYDSSVPGEHPLRWETVVAWAEAAERLGFGSVWLSDHLSLPLGRYGGGPAEDPCLDPLVVLPALARRTSRVRLGLLTLCGPLRPPAVVAKALATADLVAGGRVVVGVGAGWHDVDLAALGRTLPPPGERLRELEEVLEVLDAALRGDVVDHRGARHVVEGARIDPGPAQSPRPPLLVGGKGDRLLELVARRADGWNTVWRWTPESWSERDAVLARACESIGRDPASVERSLGLTTLVGEDERDLSARFDRLREVWPGAISEDLDEWRSGRLVGSVDQVRDQIARWRDLGVSTIVCNLGAVPFSVTHPDDLELLSSAVP